MTRDEAPECSQDFIDYIGTTPCDLPPPHRDDCCRVHECWYGRTGNAYRAGYAAGRRVGIEAALTPPATAREDSYEGDFCTPTMTVQGCGIHDPTAKAESGKDERRWICTKCVNGGCNWDDTDCTGDEPPTGRSEGCDHVKDGGEQLRGICDDCATPAQKDAGRRWVCDATDCRRSFKNEQDEGCFHFLPGSPSEGDPRVYCTTETFTAYVPEAALLAERDRAEKAEQHVGQTKHYVAVADAKVAVAEAERDAALATLENYRTLFNKALVMLDADNNCGQEDGCSDIVGMHFVGCTFNGIKRLRANLAALAAGKGEK